MIRMTRMTRLLATLVAWALLLAAPEGTEAALLLLPNEVSTVAVDPLGRWLASGSDERSVRIWDPATGALLHALEGHTGRVWALAADPQGRWLASGSEDKTVRVWDPATGTLLHALEGHSDRVSALAADPQARWLASGSEDKTVRVWDPATGTLLHTLEGHSDRVWALAADPQGRWLASGSEDKTVRVWDPATGTLLHTLAGHTKWVRALAADAQGRWLASGSYDNTVRVWDPATGALLHTLGAHSKVQTLTADPQGRWLASGLSGGTVQVWDAATGALLHTLDAHSRWVLALAADPQGRWLASGADDRTVRVWDPAIGTLLHTLEGHSSLVLALTAIPQEGWPASGSYGGTAEFWDRATGALLHTLDGHAGSVSALAADPRGHWLASGSGDGAVRVWDQATGALLRTLEGHTDQVWALAVDPLGSWLASGSRDGTVRVWDPATGTLLHTLSGNSDGVWILAADPQGHWLASGSRDGTMRVWNPATGALLQTLQHSSDLVFALATDPQGRWRASGLDDDRVPVWDPAIDAVFQTLKGYYGRVDPVAADTQGRWLASGSDDSTVRVWDRATGALLHTLEGHSRPVRTLAVDPRGRWLASGSDDNTVRVWEAVTGTLINTLKGHSGSVQTLAADPQGLWLASGSDDETVRVWDTTHWELIGVRTVGRDDEWASWDAPDRLTRSESGGLVLAQTEGQGLQPMPPSPTAKGTDLMRVSSTPPERIAADGLATWTIEVRNSSTIPAHWIRAKSAGESDTLTVYGSRTEIRLNPGEQTRLELKVAVRRLPVGKDPEGSVQGWPERASLPSIRIMSAGGAGPLVPGGQEIPVERPRLAPRGELLEDGKTIRVTLANQGTGASGPLRIRLGSPACRAQTKGGETTDGCRRLLRLLDSLVEDTAVQSIPALGNLPVPFAAQEKLTTKDLERLSLLAYRTQGPATDWDFPAIPISGALPVWLLSAAALLLLATAGAVYYWRRYQHPLVTTIGRDAQAIFALAPERLPEAERRLRLIRRLDGAMDALGLPRASLGRVRAWLSAPAAEQAQELAERLGATCDPLEPDGQRAEPPVWRLGLQAFPLNLSTLALTLVPAGPRDPEGLLQGLRERLDAVRGPGTGGLPLLIFCADGETQWDLNRRTADRRDRLIAPAPEVLTRLLLAPEPALVLARALAERIPRTELSPYQTGGGVQDPRMFFGRAGLLDHIVNRDPGNYLIVGGRQVGKSSLLQAVARALAGSTRVQVHYCPLGGADLAGPLAAALGLAAGAGLADIESLLHRSGDARPRVLLIDESDAFVRADADRDYAVLKRLRGLSESGLAYFSFAGYWTLFERSALDFHSPLKNFGELIQVEELEWEACLALVQRPLGWLGLSLASNALAERLVRDCGQRANLIAMACHQLVARVRPEQREIGAADLEAVLAGERLRDELLGNWRALVADETEQRLDRMVVYASVDWDGFGYGELAARLAEAGLAVDPERLERSLRRLRLAFVLGLQDGRYCYRVPLQQRLIRQDDPGIRLGQEIAQWAMVDALRLSTRRNDVTPFQG